MRKKNFNICIPIYNESQNLEELISDLNKFVEIDNTSHTYNIVFYDDGSTDNTLNILKKYKKITVLEGKENMGLGHAIKSLIEHSLDQKVDGIFKIDGDNQMKVREINNFLRSDFFEDSDVIYGNRFNSKLQYSMPKMRKLGSTFFRYLLKIFSINVSDPTNGFIYLSKRYINNYKIIGAYNAAQQILLDAKLRNLVINEIDITVDSRSVGMSFIGIKYPVIVISNMIALLAYRKTVRYLISPGLISLFSGTVLLIINIVNWLLGKKETVISDNILILLIIVGIQLSIMGFLLEIYKNQKN